jgi:hypothetical protein
MKFEKKKDSPTWMALNYKVFKMPSHLVRPKGCHQLVILKLKIIVEKES